MGQQVLDGDARLVRRDRAEEPADRVVDAEPALHLELEDGGRGELLGDRADVVDGVARGRRSRLAVGHPEALAQDDAVAVAATRVPLAPSGRVRSRKSTTSVRAGSGGCRARAGPVQEAADARSTPPATSRASQGDRRISATIRGGGLDQSGQQSDVGGGLRVPLDRDAEPVAQVPPWPPACRRRRARTPRSRGAPPRTGGGGSSPTGSRRPAPPPGSRTRWSPRPRRTRRRRGLCSSWPTRSGCAGRASRRRAPPSAACPGRRPARAGRQHRRRPAGRTPRRPGPGASWPCAGAAPRRTRSGSTSAPPRSPARPGGRPRPSAAPGASVGGSSTGTPPTDVTASAYCAGRRSARWFHTPQAASSR